MPDVPAIACERMSVFHGKTPGVVDLDLTVHQGEVFGFLGPNGAGKTTTIRTFLDLLRPDSGSVRVLGCDVRDRSGAARARIGYLPGDLALFAGERGDAVLDLFGRLQRRPSNRRREILDRLGFPQDALRRKCRTYSTGMRQMIGIAATFQHDPELLILDEPTTGLDPIVRDAFLDLVRDARAAGKTVFLSSHILSEVADVADRVGLIANARLRVVDTVSNLRRKWPRRVRVHMADGSVRESRDVRPIRELLASLGDTDVADLEITPAGLDDVFRAVINGETP